MYFFGLHVESELARVSEGKKPEEAKRQREAILHQLLTPPPPIQPIDQANGGLPPGYDPTDPLSPETYAAMARKHPPVKFTGQQFQDPADLFNGKKKPTAVKHV